MSKYEYASDALSIIPDTLEANEEYTAMESLTASASHINQMKYSIKGTKLNPKIVTTYGPCMEQGKIDYSRLIISSKDNVVYRLYLTELSDICDPKFLNRAVRLLRQLKEHQILHIYMGSEVYGGYPVFNYGSLVDAIQRTNCKVITHVNGRAGCSETYLWLYGHERYISEFGVLYFTGLQDCLKYYPEWRSYFKTFMDKAVSLRLLTDTEVTELLTTNRAYRFMASEVYARINAPLENDHED